MTAFSKECSPELARGIEELGKRWLKGCTCSEFAHTWDPSCIRSNALLWPQLFLAAGKMYLPLFVIPAILRRKGPAYLLKRTLPEVARSSAFIGTFATSFLALICVFRKLTGRFRVLTAGFTPGLLASCISFPIERSSRRQELAIYCANQAAEATYRMLEQRGYVKFIKGGDAAIFVAAFAICLYFSKKEPRHLGGAPKAAFNLLVGPESVEEKKFEVESHGSHGRSQTENEEMTEPTFQEKMSQQRPRDGPLQKALSLLDLKTPICSHHESCVERAIKGYGKGFILGFGLKAALSFVASVIRFYRRPKKLIGAVFHKSNFRFGLFVSALAGGSNSILCALRAVRGKEDGWNSLVAGAVSALGIFFSPSTEMAMYLAAKAAEACFKKLVEMGFLKTFKHGDLALFAFSCAIMFHCSVFEPHNLRRSYWNFLMKATKGKFGLVNRNYVEFLGMDPNRVHRLERTNQAASAQQSH